jgi:hypothetical protein
MHLRPELLASGYTDGELQRLCRGGDIERIRRGAYIEGGVPDDERAAHILRVRAAMEYLSDEAVVSHVSAAILHGLPVWGLPLSAVDVTRGGRRRGGRCGSHVHVRTATLDPAELVVVDGIPVTSVERTIVDVARSVPFTQAVVIADGALAPPAEGEQRRQADAGRSVEILAAMRRWPGAPSAQRVLAFADGRSGSVGESRSRVALAAAGLPPAELQWELHSHTGARYLADFAWPSRRTIGEFDGQVKYGRELAPGQEPGDVVFAEKVREDAIRALDLEVVRWTWADLADFDEVVRRLRTRFR